MRIVLSRSGVDRKAMSTSLAAETKAGVTRAGAQAVRGVEKRWRPTIPVTGTLSPLQESDVGFKTGGRLVAVRVKVGDRVAGAFKWQGTARQPLAIERLDAEIDTIPPSFGVRLVLDLIRAGAPVVPTPQTSRRDQPHRARPVPTRAGFLASTVSV